MVKKMVWTLGICVLLLGNAGAVYSGMTQTQVSQLYVAIFGRASEGQGNTFWQTQPDMASAAAEMLGTQAAKDYFGTSLDTNQAFIEHIYTNTLNKTVSQDPEGITYWVGRLYDGVPRGEVVALLVTVIEEYAPDTGQYYNPTDAATVAAYHRFVNRVEISNYMADHVEAPPDDWQTVTAFHAGLPVTDNPSTVQTAKTKVMALAQGGSDPQPASYVWVLAETIHEDGASQMAETNRDYEGVYTASGEYEPCRYMTKMTYVGPAEDGKVHGEHATYRAMFTPPPSVIDPGEIISTRLILEPLTVSLSFFDFKASARALLNGMNLENWNGAYLFTLGKKQGYYRVDETLSIEAPGGSREGERMELQFQLSAAALMKTIYLYEYTRQ